MTGPPEETTVASALEKRYGANFVPQKVWDKAFANPTVRSVLQHRSVRHFEDKSLPEGTLEILGAAAQSCSTSCNISSWSVVAVEDKERKDKAAMLSGDQQFIRDAPLYLVFCADLSRITELAKMSDTPSEGVDYIEMFIMAAIDAALAAQSLVCSAEALGLGCCFVGGARNQPQEMAELLGLPNLVIGLFGLAVGFPTAQAASPMMQKPRLSQKGIIHREQYSEENRTQAAVEFEEPYKAFWKGVGREVPHGGWAAHSSQRVKDVASLQGRHVYREVLQQRGFKLK